MFRRLEIPASPARISPQTNVVMIKRIFLLSLCLALLALAGLAWFALNPVTLRR